MLQRDIGPAGGSKQLLKTTPLRRAGKRGSIKSAIIGWIAQQKLAPGDMIVGQNELARHFSVTQVTMFKALRELASEGVVHRINGKGTFVGPEPRVTARKSLCLVLPGAGLDQPEHNPEYWTEVQALLRAFITAAGEQWSFSVHSVRPKGNVERAARELVGCDAVFFHHTKEPTALLRKLLQDKLAPVVAFGMPGKEFPCLTVDYDRPAAARLGVSHLAELGYRRIAFVGSREAWGDMSLDGYRQALGDFGLPVDEALIVRVGEAQQDGYRGAAMLLNKQVKFDAVFADRDMRALGVLECLRQQGIRVPQQVGVMGFDGVDYACRMPPFLTSVEIPHGEMIRAALARLETCPGPVSPAAYIEVRCRVLPGQTAIRQTS